MAKKYRNPLKQAAQELRDLANVIKNENDGGADSRYKHLVAQGLALLLVEVAYISFAVFVGLGIMLVLAFR